MNRTPKESGFALITVLVIQLMIGIIAYAAMETASLGSQQTIASRQGHTVYNGAEQRLLSGIRCIQANHNNGVTGSDLIGTCTEDDLTLVGEALGAIRLTAIDEMSMGARRTLSVLVTPPLPNNFYDADGAYTCFGSNCQFNPPTSAASPGADGTDRLLPGQEAGDSNPLAQECGTQGSHRPPVNPDGENKAGIIIPTPNPNGSIGGSDGGKGNGKGKGNSGGGKSQFEGNPPVVDNAETYNELYGEEGELAWEAVERAEGELNARIDALSDKAESFEGEFKELGAGETGIWIVKEGQTLTLGGKTAGGTVILEGGTLELKGNTCFAGMVVGRNGGQISASGTPAIVGAALQISGFMEDASMKGNASIYYSSSVLKWAQSIANGAGSGDQWTITDFNQVTGQ
ncbi:type II secretion system protein [Marinobacter nauticus]|uniref:Type 4 fimbrial biogenesis protein PilX N-terminal domain-containing protein n=1 Tax=Marinobacter nauticus TaxID=2743 RepID=A0A1M2UVZ1_MARNT|nr:type II secretion system protein [Marinobacter nauticus]OJS99504.1 hypothetical protein BEE62_05040 [Marinobacter nauticus]